MPEYPRSPFEKNGDVITQNLFDDTLKLLGANKDILSLGDTTHEGGDIAIYRDTSGNIQLRLDADATSNEVALDVYGGVNCQNDLSVHEDIYNQGLAWTIRTSATDNNWFSVTYGNGLFVAVARSGTGNRVMTSPDGTTWTTRTSAADNGWYSVTYGNGLFVAVADTGTGNRVMTSPDGTTWTTRTSAADNGWLSVTYGNGLFVAVAYTGTGNRVMTSPDGIIWTTRTSAADNNWFSVTYGNGLFVAVARSGTGNRVMTSPDGTTWTTRTSAADNNWFSVTYGNGLFVAVANTGTGNRVMTSPDGIIWTIRTSAADNGWLSVTYGNGLFVAVANTGNSDRVMTSPDGTTWTTRTSAADNGWYSVTYGNGLFVAVANTGNSNRVMTSGKSIKNLIPCDNIYHGETKFTGNHIVGGAQFARKTDGGAADYNPSAITSDYIISVDTTLAARTVIISTEDRDSGSVAKPRIFIVKDIAGNATNNNITISLETAGTIDGNATEAIFFDYGKRMIMIDGTNGFTI